MKNFDYYKKKKKVFEAELKPIADALGITVEYTHPTAEHYQDEELVIDGTYKIIVNCDSTYGMKRDFIKGIYNMFLNDQLTWVDKGQWV